MAQNEESCKQTFFVSKAADAFYDSGKLYHIDGQHELAIQDYTEAIRLDPQYAIAYRDRGVVYSDLGQHQRSIQDYGEAIRLGYSPLTHPYHNRGLSYRRLGQSEQAERDFQKARELGYMPAPVDRTATSVPVPTATPQTARTPKEGREKRRETLDRGWQVSLPHIPKVASQITLHLCLV